MLHLAWDWLRPEGLSSVHFVGEFTRALHRQGVPREHLRSEHFAFR